MAPGKRIVLKNNPRGGVWQGPIPNDKWVSEIMPWASDLGKRLLVLTEDVIAKLTWTHMGARVSDFASVRWPSVEDDYIWIDEPTEEWLRSRKVISWPVRVMWIKTSKEGKLPAQLDALAKKLSGFDDYAKLDTLAAKIERKRFRYPSAMAVVAKHHHKKYLERQGITAHSAFELVLKHWKPEKYFFACVDLNDWTENPAVAALVKKWGLE
ncbi:unknown [Singapore grouper iridovirus]|uniref:Uncharacterized protein n=1 Tax=Singapore grouper iridovirus TaxID=262968 RepID=Q5YFE3_9VIRU|nr:hypothetical protein ORF122L [Singapore grouper iridovirus]AAS18137.1 unknown [Singapore grouper iridovirus]WAU86831.1 hypothetical protein ORF122L [Singapore grouper iridovirus]